MIVYIICLTVGLLFTFISAIASHFFGGHDAPEIGTGGAAEAGFDSSGVPGISFFSPTVLSIFVTSFGAFGLIFSKIGATQSPWLSAPLALVGGGIVAVLGFLLFNAMFRKTQSSSESRVATLIGQSASIITPIPENGVGEIAYVQGGIRYTAPARTTPGRAIPSGQPVKITRIIGTQFYVEATG
ncbi:MAG TPA: NfeD family protein [Verrucomicrobiota bacterium]|nr:NfeD family protein [Verrucomicrobiota bacterium]HNT14966.1 NfeD family protein [Verrucomicrobiota bacterium]